MTPKTIKIGPHIVPSIWHYIVPEDFHFFRFPEEKKATCASCPKICDEGFYPDTRCCTYHPRIANFMLGLALADLQTKEHVEGLIKAQMATPEGMQQTATQQKLALEKHAADEFGKNREVICRFLDLKSGFCQFYAYRNAVCSTFFCINDQGEKGHYFWNQVQIMISQIETALSQWAMKEVGMNVDEYFARFNALADNLSAATHNEHWSESSLRQLWADWYGREVEFFRNCSVKIQENKDRLFAIACETEIKAPHTYDEVVRASFDPSIQKVQDQNAPVGGTPVPIEDLWYLVKKAHHDLWA